ncbi:hypothetical protein PG984_001147 [Apiospora sp. TS-2023a]
MAGYDYDIIPELGTSRFPRWSTYGISQYRKGPSPIDAAPRVAQAQAQGAMHYWQNVGSKGEHPPRTHP